MCPWQGTSLRDRRVDVDAPGNKDMSTGWPDNFVDQVCPCSHWSIFRLHNKKCSWNYWNQHLRNQSKKLSIRFSKPKQKVFKHLSILLFPSIPYPPGNDHISPQNGTFEDDFPFPKVGYVNFLEGQFFFWGDKWKAWKMCSFPFLGCLHPLQGLP